MIVGPQGGVMRGRLRGLLICALAAAASLFADDGSWSTEFRLAEGSFYARTENPDIALEDEILAFDGFETGLTRALFYFRNTAARDLTVEAGFPVRVRIGLTEDAVPGKRDQRGFFLSQGKYDKGVSGFEYAELALGPSLKQAEDPADEFVERSSYYFNASELPGRKELPADVCGRFGFSISQDGKPVACHSVVQETALTNAAGESKALEVTFHFRHSLAFKAGARSAVRIEYAADYASGADSGGMFIVPHFSYTYILGTGRTWKGPIARLYLALPQGLSAQLPQAFARLGRLRGRDVYLAAGYEPAEEDVIAIESRSPGPMEAGYLKYLWFESGTERMPPKNPAQDFVVVKGASSSLQQTAPAYTPGGLIRDAEFGPLSLFDGIAETAWCEGAKGDGIGEWVEFELKQDVEALDIRNGYNMSLVKIEGQIIDTYYEKNNRPKSIEIVSTDGKVVRALALADTKELQSFDTVWLPAGTYRLTIREVYAGSKWQDTCLGEVTFTLASPLYGSLSRDSFLREHEEEIAGPPALR